jgi:hypothetical protein
LRYLFLDLSPRFTGWRPTRERRPRGCHFNVTGAQSACQRNRDAQSENALPNRYLYLYYGGIFYVCTLTLLVASAAAFSPMKPTMIRIRQAAMTSTTAQNVFLSEEETMAILNKSTECIESECSIDEVDELLTVLKDTEKELEGRIEKIMNTISHLQHINDKEERKTDEVRAFVKDMLRVFNTDKPMVFPTGYAGDVGKGARTAYDVLPPKKWVNPDKK